MSESRTQTAGASRPCLAGCDEGSFHIRCCEGNCSDGGVRFEECDACEGLGRVSERIPASDALADAETLRENAPGWLLGGWLMIANLEYCALPEVEAPRAARAAFRAVPGLRAA